MKATDRKSLAEKEARKHLHKATEVIHVTMPNEAAFIDTDLDKVTEYASGKGYSVHSFEVSELNGEVSENIEESEVKKGKKK